MASRRTQVLTVREEQILALIESGKHQKLVAHACGISVQTVKNHVQRIRLKLDADPAVHTACLRSSQKAKEVAA